MTEEDEAFNEIERMSSVRQEILRTLNRKRQIQEAERAFDEQYLIWRRNQAESERSMTQDEIIEMAKEANIWQSWLPDLTKEEKTMKSLEAFAKLVADKAFQNGYEKGVAAFNDAVLLEREACAKVCESNVWNKDIAWWLGVTKSEVSVESSMQCAAAIRARGQA